jgi:thiol-disulfide isomerase/thioredoxin
MLFMSNTAWGQKFSTSPEQPQPGDTVILLYQPGNGPLKTASQISASIYMLNDVFPEDKSVQIPMPRPIPVHLEMKKEGRQYTTGLVTSPTSKVLKVVFYSPENEIDRNDGKGYSVKMYEAASGLPVQGVMAQEAFSKLNHAYFIGLKVDKKQAFEDLSREFSLYPTSQDHFVYYMSYAGLARELGYSEALKEVEARVLSLLANENPKESELNLAFSLAQMLEMTKEEKEAYERIKQQYPNSFIVEFETQDRFYESDDLEEKERLFQFLSETFNETERQKETLGDAAMVLANAYLPVDIGKFTHYALLAKNRQQLASQANAMAWQLVGEGIDRPAVDLAQAEQFAQTAIKVIESQIADLQSDEAYGQIKYLRLNESYSAFLDTYALIFYKKGMSERALELQKKSLEYDAEPALEVVERYARYFDEIKSASDTKRMLAEKIQSNQASEWMKDRFVQLAGKKELKALLEASDKRYFDQVRKQMIQETAPDFSLKNLEGDLVSLSDYKGRVVVIDFWASWCAPCIRSFPGMQQLVEKYQDDPQVEFLFIDCWESEGTTPATISEFLAGEAYTFHVLMDVENKVVKDFGVEGIPAKFVIDKNGQIRFQDSGFRDIDHLVKELRAKIEILKGE